MKSIKSLFAALFVVSASSAHVGCATVAGEAEAPPEASDEAATDDGSSDDGVEVGALTSGQACSLQASTAAAVGVVVTGAGVVASCAGVLAVTGPGEVVCLAPAAGTALAAVVAGLAGVGSYLSCSFGGQRADIPIAQSSDASCRLGSGEFCGNLVAKYKNYCGRDVFSPTSQISCARLDLRPATATAAKCADAKKRIALATGCLTGRRMMKNFVEQGVCEPSASDPTGASHEAPIQAANDALWECKEKYRRACGDDGQATQAQTAKDFARNVYLCQ
jgi:hypothetical protein